MDPRTKSSARPSQCLAPVLVLAAACSAESAPRPNVLLVTLDTTRADYLGAYGRAGDPTPHLDALAAEGTRFDLAVSTSSLTPVSHAAILTGRFNHEHGLRILAGPGGYRLPDGVPTLATVLEERGYTTAAVHSAFPVSRHFGLERGFEHFDDVNAQLLPDEDGGIPHEWDVQTFQRRSDETTERVLDLLDGTTEPFFLWIHYWDPHDKHKRPPRELMPKRREIEAAGSRELAVYEAEVRYVDSQFGRVLDRLRETGRDANTIIVVVADHGQGLGDHGWFLHRLVYQEQIRVPLLLRAPGIHQVPVVSDLVRSVDILPTVLDYAGVEVPAGVSGRSLRGLVEGRSEPGRITFADQINLFDLNAAMVKERPNDDFLYCVMDRRWKLTYRPTRPHLSELFDLENDPGESRNLFGERLDETRRLLTELANAAPWVTEPPPPLEDGGDQEAALAALASLGYASDGEGAPSDGIDWAWICPDSTHAGDGEPGPCPVCATPRVPVRR